MREKEREHREKRDRRRCANRLQRGKGGGKRGADGDGSGTRRARIGVRAHRRRSAREDIDIFGRGARNAAATAAGGCAEEGGRGARVTGGAVARRGSRLSLPYPAVSIATSSARISREGSEA